MSNIYDRIAAKQSSTENLREVEKLRRGKLYFICDARQATSKYMDDKGKYPEKLIVHYKDCGLGFFTYMTSDYDDLDKEFVVDLKNDIGAGKPPGICYYGKLGKKNLVKLHTYGQEIDNELLEELGAFTENSTTPTQSPLKRKATSEGNNNSPKKPSK